jgi:hypothetical protein
LQSKKMLASTVQFSTTNRPPSGRTPRQTPPAHPRPQARDNRMSGTRTPDGPDTRTRPPPGHGRSTRPTPVGSAPSGPNSVPTTPHSPRPRSPPAPEGTGRTRSRQQPAAELVSVPPSSTTPHTVRHPEMGTGPRHGRGCAPPTPGWR